ncbi:MAG: carboxypeptidase regulatory-like domain-containing protein [Bryobacteraceae bacterium]
MRSRRVVTLALIAVLSVFSGQVFAQSLISGDISGTIKDATGAVIPGAGVTLRSLDTGATQTTTTNQTGAYRFSLLKPGHYRISVTQTGFQKAERAIDVAVGTNTTADLTLELGASTQTVEVQATAPLINTEPSMNTSFTPTEVQELPSAGGDITNIAFTAPGVVVNNGAGYGNFTVNGLPATSNLFTVNGENDMDPYFNINNSGAANLTLGQNEIQEATVIANPYAGQYGQLSGAQVSYVTKSGTNKFHGNLGYWWNGRTMNANNWFNNYYGASRPFSNANQWAGSIGGPIIKDKTFFFFDTEGLRFVLPNVDSVTIPTGAFANAVLANVQATQPNEASTYQKMFNLWQNAPGASAAQPIANTSACSSLVLPGFDPTTQACAARFQATPTALASEWILAGRVDQRIGNNDTAYFRYKADHGTQPTTLDPINSNFNAISHQPSWDTQVNETHIFGPTSTNQFMATLSHYVAQFQQNHESAVSTFPFQVVTSGAVPFTGFNPIGSFPQGRNITQYQFIDDFTLIRGKHNLKFGANFRRYDVSDHNFFINSPRAYFGYTSDGLQNFANGLGFQYFQNLNQASDVPVALWGMGLYAQDEWAVRPSLKLTLALRAEHNSNPVCQFNCFANFKGDWSTLASVSSADPGSVPYSSDIAYNQHQAYPGVDRVNWSPRFGFSWSPGAANKTVISGGFGLFYDNPAAGLVDDLLANPPVSVSIRVRPPNGVPVFDPGPNGGAAIWAASANAFDIQKSYGQISSQLSALGSLFAAPSITAITGTVHSPQWQEWNVQVQRQITNTFVLQANYVGNHGIHIPYTNGFYNAFDLYGLYPGVSGIAQNAIPNYGTVSQVMSGAVSNYNGLTFTARKQFNTWFTALFNYTWSHNLDETSNGGLFEYGFLNGESLLGQLSPFGLRAENYGNSDYDVRHSISGSFVVNPTFHFSSRALSAVFNGWQWSGKVFWHTGLPFSVTDNNTALGNYSGTILAVPAGGRAQTSCGSGAAGDPGLATPCLNAGAFFDGASNPTYPGWSSQTRNQFRGPHYFNTDMALFKTFKFGETRSIGVGAQAFNVFNHPNFALPDSGMGDATFGLISSMLGSPTSPYGNFLGFDSSPRVVQVSAKFVF